MKTASALANLSLRRPKFTFETWDVSGAYYFGTLPCPVRSSVPGLIIAGLRWEKIHTAYLLGEGIVQSLADRRFFALPFNPERPDNFFFMEVLVDDTFVCTAMPTNSGGLPR